MAGETVRQVQAIAKGAGKVHRAVYKDGTMDTRARELCTISRQQKEGQGGGTQPAGCEQKWHNGYAHARELCAMSRQQKEGQGGGTQGCVRGAHT